MSYSARFLDVYQRVGGNLQIDDFAKRVNPNKIGFGSKRDFYSPVEFSIQACALPHEVIRIAVPVHGNEQNWMKELQVKLAASLGGRTDESAANIQLKTVTGRPLEKVAIDKLDQVGKLHMYVNGKLKRLPSMPDSSTVPLEHSITKTHKLNQWAEKDFLAELIPVVTSILAKVETPEELNRVLSGDGLVKQKIREVLIQSSSGGWKEHVRVFHSDPSSHHATTQNEEIANRICDNVLTTIRHYVDAVKQDVSQHIQTKIAFNHVGKGKNNHYMPLLGNVVSSSSSKDVVMAEGYKMYNNVMTDALSHPMLVSSVFNSIHHHYKVDEKKKSDVELTPLAENTHHPWNRLIHHTVLPIKGQYPADYLKRHLKQDMSTKAKYVGTESRTYQMYHLFSGKHQVPPPRFIQPNPQFAMTGVSVASLIDKKMGGWKRGGGGKKKSGFDKSKKNTHSPFPYNKDMETGLPELVSLESLGIESELLECHNSTDKKHHKKKKEKNEWMNEELPELVSLEALEGSYPHGKKGSKTKKKEEKNMWMKAELPELVSLEEADFVECHNDKDERKKKKEKERIKWLVDEDATAIGDQQELVDDDFSDFPTVENVFKQTIY